MDTAGYSKWGGGLDKVPRGPCGCWGRRFLFLALALVVTAVLWAFILSILLSKASTQQGELLRHQDQLRTNASYKTVVLGSLKEDVGTCQDCCLGTQTQLKTARAELGEAQVKLFQQQSALKELSERVTQSLAEAGRDRENIRIELLRELEAVRTGNNSCEQCPKLWLPFKGSCYFFSVVWTRWEEAQLYCAGKGAHLVIVESLEEQDFLNQNTRGRSRGYWLGLRAVRHGSKVQGYQWLDGVSLSFSHWNRGEPNDSMGREDCIMMLRTGFWNDAPCDIDSGSWICEKRISC